MLHADHHRHRLRASKSALISRKHQKKKKKIRFLLLVWFLMGYIRRDPQIRTYEMRVFLGRLGVSRIDGQDRALDRCFRAKKSFGLRIIRSSSVARFTGANVFRLLKEREKEKPKTKQTASSSDK
jgi:hypothetical protein